MVACGSGDPVLGVLGMVWVGLQFFLVWMAL